MDNIKLVIEISKQEYEEIKCSEDCGLHTLTRAIAKGIPLENIREEIGSEGAYWNEIRGETDYVKGISYAIDVIDKYLKGDDVKPIFVDVAESDPKYCDRNICTRNEYNGISCDECVVNKAEIEEGE